MTNEFKSANRRIAQNTIVMYIRMLIVMGVSLYTSRVVLAELGVTDFGIYNVVGSVVTLFTFISQALGNATNRFIVFSIGKDNVEKTLQVYNTCFRVHLVIAVLIVILLETIGLWFLNGRLNIPTERFTAALLTFHSSVLVCFLSILKIPYSAEVIAHEHMGAFAALSIAETLLKLMVAIALAYSFFDKLIVYALLFLIVQFVVNILYHLYCRTHYVECRLLWKMKSDSRLYREISAFAGWSMFGNMVWIGYTQGINIMLNIFFGPVVNAARGVAAQIENAIMSFVSSFQTAITPQIIKGYAKHDMERMHNLIIYSSKFSFFLYLLFAIPFFFEAENILKIWLVEVPSHAVNFVRLLLLVLLFNPIANPLGVSNDATGKIKTFQIVCSLINLQIIIISYLFLKLGYPPEVVYVIHAAVLSIQTFVKLIFAHKQIALSLSRYFKEVVAKIVLVGISSFYISFMLYQYFGNNIIGIVLYSVICAFSILVSSYILGLNKIEKNLVHNIVLKYMKVRNDIT